jgi:hypothetical protein
MNDLEEFRQLYHSIFRNPRQEAPIIHTKRFGRIWVDLTPIEDWLAGPLYSIKERGECNYVFADRANRFPGIVTPDDFLRWCLVLAKKYRDGILAHAPRDEAERADQGILLQMADGMVTLSHLANRVIGK